MRVLITRPKEDAAALAETLRARGHEPVLAPMLRIEPLAGVVLELDGVQAILFTSANGVRAFARLSPFRGLPVFAVGDASARTAQDAGFTKVASAAGDVEDLARLAAARLKPGDGALFHGAGRQLAGDLQTSLEAAGFTLRRQSLYQATAAGELTPATRKALSQGKLDAVLFFSPRTAGTFVDLIQAGGLTAACASLDAICLSAVVAGRVRELPWRSLTTAARPAQDALLDLMDTGAVETKMSDQDKATDADKAAHDIIAKFGGIRPMASKLGVAVSTVQGWRERGSIPSSHHDQIRTAALDHKLDIDSGVLGASDQTPEDQADTKTVKPSKLPNSGQAKPPVPAGNGTPGNAAPSRPARGTWLGPFLASTVLFALGAGTAVMTQETWGPVFAPPPATDQGTAQFEALDNRIGALDSRIGTLNSQLNELGAKPGNEAALAKIETLSGEVASLTSKLETLASTASGSGDTTQLAAALAQTEARLETNAQELADLRAQLTSLGQARAAAPAKGTAMILAVLQMRDALRGAEPFQQPLGNLEASLEGTPDAQATALRAVIATLRPYAAAGAPGLESLQASFPAVARVAIAQSRGGGSDTWAAKAMRRLSALVSIRPLGPVEGDSAEARVARAETHLDTGDLASAVRELGGLSGPAADATAEWRDRAQARLKVQAALTQLGGLLTAGLGQD